MKETEPRFAKINELNNKILMLKNANSYLDGQDISEKEKAKILKQLEKELDTELKKPRTETMVRVGREEYFTAMFNVRDMTRVDTLEGKMTPEQGQSIILIIQGNIQTIKAAEEEGLLVRFYRQGQAYTYQIYEKGKLGFNT